MKQQNLKQTRDYQKNPRSGHEPPDLEFRSDIDFEGEISLTKQSEAEACDINNIMKKYEQTGLLPMVDGRQPQYGDFASMASFQESLNIVSEAQSMFMALPAEVRARFQNDAGQFLGFVERGATEPEVMAELVKLGLADKKQESAESILSGIRENTKPRKTKQATPSAALTDE